MAKECYHKINSQIKTLEKDIRNTNNNPRMTTDNNLQTHKAYLTSQLKQLWKKNAKYKTNLMKAKLANHGKKMGGVWSTLGKMKKPRNPIYRLKIPNSNPVQYKCHSKGITKLARDHHERLQEEDIDTNISQDEYTTNLEDLLRNIPESQHVPELERSPMNWKITKAQV